MNRGDGRLEPGQPLAGAITARAWNRAQDAADIVLGATPGTALNEALITSRLPCVTARLSRQSAFGQVVVLKETQALESGYNPVEAIHIESEKQESFSDAEKALLGFTLLESVLSGSQNEDNEDADLDNQAFGICVGNESHLYAISGFAFARVRFWQQQHRYARIARNLDNYYSLTEISPHTGMMESCFWGPARIVGYCGWDAENKKLSLFHNYPFTQFSIRWALLRF